MSRVAFVVAVSRNGVIGRDGGLPWHISTDLKRFKAITMGKPLIMGRKTWESLPKKPLPGRPNIVITRQKNYRAEGAIVVSDIPSALAAAGQVDEVCVIGGGEIFDMFLPQTDRIYLTEVDLEVDGDTFFPMIDPAQWTETAREIYPRGSNDSAGFVLRVLDRNA
jgi:dihydrofolate reductase